MLLVCEKSRTTTALVSSVQTAYSSRWDRPLAAVSCHYQSRFRVIQAQPGTHSDSDSVSETLRRTRVLRAGPDFGRKMVTLRICRCLAVHIETIEPPAMLDFQDHVTQAQAQASDSDFRY